MTEDRVFEAVIAQITAVLPRVPRERISAETRLEDLGADSIDRSDILTGSLDSVGSDLALVRLGEAKDVGSLVKLLHASLRRS